MAVQIDYFRAVVRNWVVIAAVIAAALLAALIVSAARQRVYESSAQLIVGPATGGMQPTDVIRTVEGLDRRTLIATFARIPAADPIQRSVMSALKVPPESALKFQTNTSVVPNTNVIRIDVAGPDAALTAAIANGVAEASARQVSALYPIYALRMLSPAATPEKPSYPDTTRNVMVGAALGIFLGIAAALAIERLRPAAEDEEEWS